MPEHLELVIFGLLVAVAGFVVLSGVLKVPYPISLGVVGLALSLLPGLPALELPPDLVLMVFLPPLLYSAAYLLFATRPQGQLQADSVPFGRACAAHDRDRSPATRT
jgi:hypothetical protein